MADVGVNPGAAPTNEEAPRIRRRRQQTLNSAPVLHNNTTKDSQRTLLSDFVQSLRH